MRRYDTQTKIEPVIMVFRYFVGYWNNRRICHAIGGIPSALKRQRYYNAQIAA